MRFDRYVVIHQILKCCSMCHQYYANAKVNVVVSTKFMVWYKPHLLSCGWVSFWYCEEDKEMQKIKCTFVF